MRYFCSLLITLLASSLGFSKTSLDLLPAKGSADVCVDTHLIINFDEAPLLGSEGFIRVYDLSTSVEIDSLDLSIPAGPTQSRKYGSDCSYLATPYNYARTTMPTNRTCRPGTPSHPSAVGDEGRWQLNIIGGFTDGFHFHPILVRGNKAVIYLHNNVLEYNHTYQITIDKSAFRNKGFKGITKKDAWTFTTKTSAPAPKETFGVATINVRADGRGDFATIQGALDFIPDYNLMPTIIKVNAGDYEEIVYARNKTNVRIVGDGKSVTKVHYANNEVFNPHPLKVKTNEWTGTFPSRRAAFMLDNCSDIQISNITIATDLQGQAEGLLLNGERILLRDVHIIGSGDALQANGTICMSYCRLDGGGDTILGRGSLYAVGCDFRNDGGPFTWVRNTAGTHGDVFIECSFSCPDGRQCDYGRTSSNKGTEYPHAELVFIDCRVKNLKPSGWGDIGLPTNVMLEYNTTDITSGKPVDVSQRHPYSRQLSAETDAELIESYRNPAFVLKGWRPF